MGRGRTRDIAREVISCYRDYSTQCAEIVEPLKEMDYETQCRSVFDYVCKNVRYIADAGDQLIKSPARLLADGYGDCKSMSIFTASCLTCLKIPFVFRFVSFTNSDNYTHVYIVACPDTENQIIIDPVERTDMNGNFVDSTIGNFVFNKARPYKRKMDVKGTNIYRLTGIGTTASGREYTYFKDGSDAFYNTRAKNEILAMINLKLALLDVETDDVKIAELLNDIDLYCVSLHAYDATYTDNYRLSLAGSVIQGMVNNNLFTGFELSDEQRSENIQFLYQEFDIRMQSAEDILFYGNFTEWWEESIIGQNVNETTAQQKENYENYKASEGINGGPADVDQKIYDAGPYFLYLWLPENEDFSDTIRKRRQKEYEYYQWLCAYSYGIYEPKTIWNMCYAGTVRHYGKTPKKVFEELKRKGKRSVYMGGDLIAVLTAISLIIGIIVSLVQLVKSIFDPGLKGYEEPTAKEIGVPEDGDWGLENTTSGLNAGNIAKYGLIAAAGIMIISLLKNKNK